MKDIGKVSDKMIWYTFLGGLLVVGLLAIKQCVQ